MPTAATEILETYKAKASLRIDGAAGDTDLEDAIAAAVAYCERVAGLPLLDRDRTFFLDPPALKTGPLIVPVIYVKPGVETTDSGDQPRGVGEIAYWTTAGALRAEPDGEIDVANLGRVDKVNRDCTGIWPDADGWPDVLTDSQFKVTVTQGWVEAADIPGIDGVRRAVTLMAGVYYDGTVEESHQTAVRRLLEPFMDARFRV